MTKILILFLLIVSALNILVVTSILMEGVFDKGYGEECSPWGRFCDDTKFLSCDHSTGKCGCINSKTERAEDGVCKLKWNQPCKTDSDAQECYGMQECVRNSCACLGNLVPDKEYICVLKYNALCSPGNTTNGKCDSFKHHQCIGGRCSCPEGSILHHYGYCVGNLGTSCGGQRNPPCDDHMICSSSGKCACDASIGVEDNGNLKCRKLFGAPCKALAYTHGNCDHQDRFLTCEGGRCVCDSHHREKEQGKNFTCVGDLGALCKSDKNCNDAKGLVCNTNFGKCDNGSGRLQLSLQCVSLTFLLLLALNRLNSN